MSKGRIIWVFVILAQAKMLDCDVIMRAVKKSTLLRERVLIIIILIIRFISLKLTLL